MQHDPLTMFCYTDLSGIMRGKGFPSSQIERRLERGIGWTPNNLMFTALGTIAPGGWGAHGDVMLIPDRATAVDVDYDDGSPAERFFLCDVQNTDGTPWECCPRTLLREAAADLLRETGLVLKATFEHEFIYFGAESRGSDMYALQAVRRHGRFGETYLGALRTAAIEVDSYLPEFEPGQFEVSVPPLDAVAACDTATIVRELAHATAFRLGHNVSFAPRIEPDGLGNGVHIHFSLWDQNGNPVSQNLTRPFQIGEKAGQFLSGIVRHMPALCAFSVPSPISYLRLVSHSWTGVWSNVGYRDREAGLRICPTFGTDPDRVARQFNFEYRAADATANPYLQLAMILRAGLTGILEGLPAPSPTEGEDPEMMSETDRKEKNIKRLPSSLDEALAALKADPIVTGFLPEKLLEAYLANKGSEAEISREWGPAELCKRYVEIY
ncbi:MAG TPA: glutamine synthetase family protein [Phycisphaerae bacterium]|nr:glutamine synthetase family protein [Phycisphaerae bacterium]